MDEESMRATVAAYGGVVPPGDPAPPLSTWTQEAQLLAQTVDELRALRTILIKVNSSQGANVPAPQPVQRPRSAWPKIEAELRLGKHAALVARLIPRAEAGAPPE